MDEPTRGIEEYLDHCFTKFFAPLVDSLRLTDLTKEVADLGGVYEATGNVIRVRLVNDRGLASFEVAPAASLRDYWDVELVSGLFDANIRRKGVRRLNLEEQAALLESRWSDLTALFGQEEYASTRARLEQLGLQRASYLFGP